MKSYIIRKIKESELDILEDLLYEAIYQPEGADLLDRSIIETPEINVYTNNFGAKPDDYCLVAEVEGKIIGAVWIRILADEIKGFGNIDDFTPEFAISLYKEYRNQGIGTKLMKQMIEHMRQKGFRQTSLSVNKENYAFRMYEKLGFKVIKENNHDYLMLLTFKS